MYANSRYFTITGEHVDGTPETIEPRQAALDALFENFFPDLREKRDKREKSPPEAGGGAGGSPALSDSEILDLAFGARNGARIRALYEMGDLSPYDGDDSRADQALANLLAFYTGDDEDQLWRLIQASALYRPKWDRRDYRDRTFRHAIDRLTDVYHRQRERARVTVVEEDVPRIVRVGRAQVDTETGEVVEDTDDWPAPMDEAAFYGTLGAFVKSVSVETEADPAAVLIMSMSAISAVFNPHTFIKAGDAHHPIRINAVLVGPTAWGRKGTAGKIAEAVVRQADDAFGGQIVEGLSSGEGLLWAIRDEITKRDPKTGADVVADAGVADKRLWVLETEFATTLRVLQRDGNSLSPIIRRAWDIGPGGVLRSLTKNSPARATGAHIAIAGHITRHELVQTIERTDLVNGFANRFLWAACKRSRTLPFGEEVNPELVREFAEMVSDSRDWTCEGHRMRWAADAREQWAAAYASLGSDRDDLYSAVTARGAPQVLRMTELYAALEGDDQMRGYHLAAAMAVWQYVERTCRWIWGDSLGDPLADELLAALRRNGPMTRNDLYELFKRHERRARIEQALVRLLLAGLATCTKESTAGRPAEIWAAA
jgi:hypothetical protein